MKWEDGERSQNIEVECLGKRTPLDGSPESQAALECLAEVNNIHRGLVARVNENMKLAGVDPRVALEASVEVKVRDALFDDQSAFVDIKLQESKNKGPIEKLLYHLAGKDSYQTRVEEFKQYLNIPPLETESQKKGAIPKEPARVGNK